MNLNQLQPWIAGHWPIVAAAAAAGTAVLIAGTFVARTIRRASPAKVITALINTAAIIATSVQASGQWKFFRDTMGLAVGFRIAMFAFMEIGLLACALRARHNVEEGGDAGIDGVLVWVLALSSGLMSSSDAASDREGAMRVLVAVIVSLLWSRDLMAAKQAARKKALNKKPRSPIRWRITGERVFVWLRLADAVDTDVAKLDAGRRVATFLRLKSRETNGWRWPLTAKARVNRQRLRMVRDALAQSGESAEVYQTLAEHSRTDAMHLLGITTHQTGPSGPDRPDGPDGGKTDRTGPDPSGPDGQTGAGPDLNFPVWLGDWTDPDQTLTPDRTGPDTQTAGPADRTGQTDQTPAQTGPAQTAPDRPRADQTGPADRTRQTDRRTGQTDRTTGPDRQTRRVTGNLEQLETACRDWARDNNVDPTHMRRRDVLKACHAAGYSCSNERASDVQALLDPKGATAERERELTGPGGPDRN